jgi:hydroxysqualene dehydroxylase
MKATVVGGGLAGLAAALELVDGGHEVTLYEARPALGGKVQTLPERDGDPIPPPDNGQHIALGCFLHYQRFLDRIGKLGDLRREKLRLPVIAVDGSIARLGSGLRGLLRYSHLTMQERAEVVRVVRRLGQENGWDNQDKTFGELLRDLGQSQRVIDRFWDVFIRPALNLRTDEAGADYGMHVVFTALLSKQKGSSDALLPTQPLSAMHGDAAGSALEAAGASVQRESRVEALDELDADGIVLAVPPHECALLLDEPEPDLGTSPIVSVHLQFDRVLLPELLAGLLDSPAHWVFDRGRLMGLLPEQGQYLTVVSSGAPELLEVRGRELVDLIAGALCDRLGSAELLWSRVSREPEATFAARPGTSRRRPEAATGRPNVVRAGAWTATGWPGTMEGAVISGMNAARALSEVAAKVAA